MKSAVRLAGTMLLAFGASTFTARANAQQPILKVKIPFAFTIGETLMPAGEYTVTSRDSFLVVENNGHTAGVQSFASHDESGSGSRLVFYQYGNEHFLHEVSSPNGSLNRIVAPSKSEKEARQLGVPTVVAVR